MANLSVESCSGFTRQFGNCAAEKAPEDLATDEDPSRWEESGNNSGVELHFKLITAG